jgi:uncharacterized membrane protein
MITEADAPTHDLPDARAGVRGRKHRILTPSLSGAGVEVGAFFAVSLLPSLVPRAPYVQGVVSGITTSPCTSPPDDGHVDPVVVVGQQVA